MMIIKLKDWQIYTERFLSKENLQDIDSLKSLENLFKSDLESLREEKELMRMRHAVRLRSAKNRSYSLGYRQGAAKGLSDIMQSFGSYVLLWKSVEPAIVAAALNSINNVLGKLPGEHLMAAQIRDAFQAARNKSVIRLHVDPESAESVEAILTSLSDMIGAQVCELIVDVSLQAGSCLVETDQGIVDGSTSRQLEAIRQGLECALRSHRIQGDKNDEPQPESVD